MAVAACRSSMSCRPIPASASVPRRRISTSSWRQLLHVAFAVFVSPASIVRSDGLYADCYAGTALNYAPSVCTPPNQPTCCEGATLDEISSSLRRFRNALRWVRTLHTASERVQCTRSNRRRPRSVQLPFADEPAPQRIFRAECRRRALQVAIAIRARTTRSALFH
jgi:hypothetical protein